MEFTVLTFSKIQFRGSWSRSHDSANLLSIYSPGRPTKLGRPILLVVTRSPTGEITYEFIVPSQQQVWVSNNENIVQIPAICVKAIPEDVAKCAG